MFHIDQVTDIVAPFSQGSLLLSEESARELNAWSYDQRLGTFRYNRDVDGPQVMLFNGGRQLRHGDYLRPQPLLTHHVVCKVTGVAQMADGRIVLLIGGTTRLYKHLTQATETYMGTAATTLGIAWTYASTQRPLVTVDPATAPILEFDRLLIAPHQMSPLEVRERRRRVEIKSVHREETRKR